MQGIVKFRPTLILGIAIGVLIGTIGSTALTVGPFIVKKSCLDTQVKSTKNNLDMLRSQTIQLMLEREQLSKKVEERKKQLLIATNLLEKELNRLKTLNLKDEIKHEIISHWGGF